MQFLFYALTCIAILASCSKEATDSKDKSINNDDNVNDVENADAPFYLEYRLNSFDVNTALFEWDKSVVISDDLEEASGIIESRHHVGYFYKHNDSGSDARIYLFNENGERSGQYKINGITAIDYEDIAINTEDGEEVIYLGDFGDNKLARKSVYIYRFKEPKAQQLNTHFRDTIQVAQTIEYKYSAIEGEGTESFNCEALMVDPISKDIFVITKSKPAAHLYKITYPYHYNQMNYATHCGTFSFPPNQITAADISADGKQILLKTYEHVIYWERDVTKTIDEVLQQAFTRVPYIGEPQGEAICFTKNGGYLTVSEKNSSVDTKFYFYKPLN